MMDGTVMSVGRSSSSHANTKTFQNSYLYVHWYSTACHFTVRIIVILRRLNQCKKIYWKFVKCVLEISWKSPGNLLGWICRHPVENAFPIFKVSRLVRVHTDSHHNGHNNMIFAVSDVW